MKALVKFTNKFDIHSQKQIIELSGSIYLKWNSEIEAIISTPSYESYKKLSTDDRIFSIDYVFTNDLSKCIDRSGNTVTVYLE